ncbi:hypothetical protein TNCV_1585501 [Trichonephila clavipes]|nr:hypothetical protein TNCV_1585501 [Trichonephila clavipes]
MGRTELLENSGGRSLNIEEKLPCCLRFDWPEPVKCRKWAWKRLGRSVRTTRDKEILEKIPRSRRKFKGGNKRHFE